MYQQTQENAKGGAKADLALLGVILVIMVLMNRFSSAISAYVPPAAAQAVLFVGLAALCLYIFKKRLCTYRYTVFLDPGESDDDSDKENNDNSELTDFPPGTLIAEQMIGDKPRVSEVIVPDEMLFIALYENYRPDSTQRPRTLRITGRTAKTAHLLYYRRDGRLRRLLFHPDGQLISRLLDKLRNAAN